MSEAPASYSVQAAVASDVGRVRLSNEDSLAFVCPDDPGLRQRLGVLAIVADGMGGHRGGEVASALAVETICRDYFATPPGDDCLQALELAMLAANKAICRAGEADCALEGMGTTATVLVVVADEVLLAHVDDSRLYRCSNGQCAQLTEDHTLVEQMLRDGMISAEDARRHPMRNMLMRSLGTPTGLRVATRRCPPASVGDVFVLCSDGLHESFEPTEIAAIVASMEPAAASRRLVELACERDGSDNVSVVVVGIAPAAAADEAAS